MLLENADPDWIRGVAGGTRGIMWGYLLAWTPCVFVGFTMPAWGDLVPLYLGMTVASVFTLLGYFPMTAPEPDSLQQESLLSARAMTWYLAIAAFLVTLAALLMSLLNWGFPFPGPWLAVVIVMNLAKMAAGLDYARKLALRVPDHSLAGQLHIARLGIVLTGSGMVFLIDPVLRDWVAGFSREAWFFLGLATWCFFVFALFSLHLASQLATVLRRIADRQ